MANLKLIKVTGKPFSDASIGKIGIQRSNYQFDIIREGRLYSQDSSSGNGWEYATAEQIKENWAGIYPHWTPEVGDNVIVIQDYCDWANCKGTIIAKDDTSDYYRVESETGRSCIFDYTHQMILAPYIEVKAKAKLEVEPQSIFEPKPTWGWKDLKIGDKVKIIGQTSSLRPIGSIFTIDKMEDKDYTGNQPIRLIGTDGNDKGWPCLGTFEPCHSPEETATTKFKIGDRVKCIRTTVKGYGKLGTVRRVGESIGVEFDENVNGHYLDGLCNDGYGWWIGSSHLELVTESKSKEEFVNIRFLTKQEFKDKDLWAYTYPKGWNSDGRMNKYLGQSVVIPKSIIESDGSFRYQDWFFKGTDYIVTEGVSSSESVSSPAIDTKPEKRSLKVGDDVIANCGPFNNVLGKIKEIREGRFGVEFCESRGAGHHLNQKCRIGYGWYYAEDELILTNDSIRRLKTERPPRRFNVGDRVTYKSLEQCGGDYRYGGSDQGGFVGTVEHESEYEADKRCYGVTVSTKDGFCYNMLESEFHEYDGTTITETLHIHKTTTDSFTIQDVADGTVGTTVTPPIIPSFSGHVDPLSSYKQKPITIKQKPKSKLTII